MADIHHRGLTNSNSGILQSVKYSDLTVRCGSEEFKIHRAIVCPRSTFFAAACDGQFREAETSLIVLEEDDPPTVCRMLTYLYTLDYDDDGSLASAKHYMANGTKGATSQAPTTMNTPLSAEYLLSHAKMMNNVVVYAIAQKYDINELKELAMLKFRRLVCLKVPNYAILDIIGAVYETSSITDPGLRLVAAIYCAHHSTPFLADDRLPSIIEHYSEFGLDVLREISMSSARNAKLQQHFYKQLVTLYKGMAELVENSSEIDDAVAELLQALKTTDANLERMVNDL